MAPNREILKLPLPYLQAEGFICGISECLSCGFRHRSAHVPGTDEQKLECLKCGATNSKFKELEIE